MKTSQLRKVLSLVLSLAMVLALGACSSQSYPNQNVTVIVPKGAGGPTDTAARTLVKCAEGLDDKLHFVCENVTGASGVTGMAQGAGAKADGYTLSMVVAELNIMSNMQSYNCPVTIDDYRFISVIFTIPMMLCVRTDSSYADVYDFVDKLEASTRIGNSGTYGMGDLAFIAAAEGWGKQFTSVPYADGDAAAITALVAENPEVDAVVVCPSSTLDAQIQAGEIKVLASFGKGSAYDAPVVSALTGEYAVDIDFTTYCALAAPKDTPDDVYDYLVEVFSKATTDAQYVSTMEDLFITAASINGGDAKDYFSQQYAFYRDLLKSLGVE